MQYLTGIRALNLPCKLGTPGDWHSISTRWDDLPTKESEDSVFGDYGIEPDRYVSQVKRTMPVANHIRALLDMISEGSFGAAEGMRDDFIETDQYDAEIFAKVELLRNRENWAAINRFMSKEYGRAWQDRI